jgi:transglutaminase-like putative cysteine protease
MSMLKIRHETLYRYTESLGYTIQQLRLIPRADLHQHTLSWNISTPGRRHAFKDAFGNLSLMLTITEPHDEVRIIVDGMVDVLPLDRGRLAEKGELSPLVFTVPTRLTQPNAAIVEFARRALPENPAGADFLSLAHAIRDAVAYETGSTDVTSTAADALQLGRGVCQDHVHLFLACCHIANTPARYVSGYIDAGATLHAGRGRRFFRLDQHRCHSCKIRRYRSLPAGGRSRLRLGKPGARHTARRRRGIP